MHDAVIIGAGHNGLVAAAYLAKAGLRVLVLERRDRVGGSAITEEIVPGFKFSRLSYVNSLFRPQIIKDLRLKEFGLKMLPRNPSSFTPFPDGQFLFMGPEMDANVAGDKEIQRPRCGKFPALRSHAGAAGRGYRANPRPNTG